MGWPETLKSILEQIGKLIAHQDHDGRHGQYQQCFPFVLPDYQVKKNQVKRDPEH
jgi:hypothetical protein